jgi:hypothetical protein
MEEEEEEEEERRRAWLNGICSLLCLSAFWARSVFFCIGYPDCSQNDNINVKVVGLFHSHSPVEFHISKQFQEIRIIMVGEFSCSFLLSFRVSSKPYKTHLTSPLLSLRFSSLQTYLLSHHLPIYQHPLPVGSLWNQ